MFVLGDGVLIGGECVIGDNVIIGNGARITDCGYNEQICNRRQS